MIGIGSSILIHQPTLVSQLNISFHNYIPSIWIHHLNPASERCIPLQHPTPASQPSISIQSHPQHLTPHPIQISHPSISIQHPTPVSLQRISSLASPHHLIPASLPIMSFQHPTLSMSLPRISYYGMTTSATAAVKMLVMLGIARPRITVFPSLTHSVFRSVSHS